MSENNCKRKHTKLYLLLVLSVCFLVSCSAFITASAAGTWKDYTDAQGLLIYLKSQYLGIGNNPDGTIEYGKNTDDNFYFNNGAALSVNKENMIMFTLIDNDSKFANREYGKGKYSYMFILLRKNPAYTYTVADNPLFATPETIEVSEKYVDAGAIVCTYNSYTDTYEYINQTAICEPGKTMDETLTNYEGESYWKNVTCADGSVGKYPFFTEIGENNICRLVVNVPAISNEYAVLAVKTFIPATEHWNLFHTKIKNVTYDEATMQSACISDYRSYREIVLKMKDAGALDNYKDKPVYDYFTTIAGYTNAEYKISWLENIKGTPFAEKKYAKVTTALPSGAENASAEQFAPLVGKDSFDTMMSTCSTFKLDSKTNTYVAYYEKSVYLKAQTADGKYDNYFLDPNLTYAGYYGQFTSDGTISNDLYEYAFNTLKKQYPDQLKNVEKEKLYGYFGFVVIPRTASANTLVKDIFSLPETMNGVIQSIKYDGSLTVAQYNKLLKTYNYSWLARLWNNAMNLLNEGSDNATYYVVCSDNTTDKAWVSESGSKTIDDNKPLIINKAGETIENVKNTIISGSNTMTSISMLVIAGVAVYALIIYINKNKKSTKRR